MASTTLEKFWDVMDRIKTIKNHEEREVAMRAIMLQGFIWVGISGDYYEKSFIEKVEDELNFIGV